MRDSLGKRKEEKNIFNKTVKNIWLVRKEYVLLRPRNEKREKERGRGNVHNKILTRRNCTMHKHITSKDRLVINRTTTFIEKIDKQ